MEVERVMGIINLRAGLGRGKKCYQKLVKWINGPAKEKGIRADVFFTEKEGERNATNLAKRAVKERYDLILIIGGDGTINEVANGVVGSEIPLLIVPAGNGNDFARALGIPKKPEKAFNLITEGRIEPVDLGKVNGRVFVNVFGVGFDAKITQYAESLKEKWRFLPNTFLYLVALLRELFLKLDYLHLETKIINGRKFPEALVGKVTLVSIANGPTCGGIFKLAPQADLKDGLLDICWIKKTSRLRIFRFLPKVRKGTHLNLPEVRTHLDERLPRAKSLIILSPEKEALPCQMDGEILPAEKEYRISLLPKTLKVFMPKTPKF